eukprot:Sro1629_g287100.1 Uncharacterized protein conserved in bacteria (DUF2330) (390) ;mRNA; r:9033-10202
MDDKVTLLDDINLQELAASSDWLVFLQALATAGVPAIPLVDSIIETYIPNTYEEGPFCSELYLPNQVFNMINCFEQYVPPSDTWVFDAQGMATDLDEKVFQPSQAAQDFIDTYSYMTRMYGVLGPETMDKDPFFSLRSDAPDVSNVHNATAVPVCVPDEGPVALDISIGGEMISQISAQPGCGGWNPTGVVDSVEVPSEQVSPALDVTSWGFEGTTARKLSRSTDGTFAEDELAEVVATADSLVVDQTVPPYTSGSSTASDGNPSTTSATNSPSPSEGGDTPSSTPAANDNPSPSEGEDTSSSTPAATDNPSPSEGGDTPAATPAANDNPSPSEGEDTSSSTPAATDNPSPSEGGDTPAATPAGSESSSATSLFGFLPFSGIGALWCFL